VAAGRTGPVVVGAKSAALSADALARCRSDIDDALRARLASALGVAQLLLLDQARRVVAAPGYRSRGQAVVSVLGALCCDASLYARLAVAGHLAGLWARPLRWDPRRAALRVLAFSPSPARGPPVD